MTNAMTEQIRSSLENVRNRIAQAQLRYGRPAGSVALLPVSKTYGAEVIRSAAALGLVRLGENRAQEIRAKYAPLEDLGLQWVMIGHLQTNKAKDIARMASEVQSLDRLELAVALNRRLEEADRTLDALVQIKTSPEPSKYGLAPEDLRAFLRSVVREAPRLRIRGLMTLAVNSADASVVRPCFRLLSELRRSVSEDGIDGVELSRLSMGMSNDFELAIEEGATEVRIGTAIFGSRSDTFKDYWP